MNSAAERDVSWRVGVSMVLWRSEPRVWRAALGTLAQQSLRPTVVAVHGNEASEELAAAVRVALNELSLPGRVTTSPDNRGFAGAHDDLVAELFRDPRLQLDAVLIMNPDVFADRAMLASMAEFGASLAEPALLGSVLELADPQTFAGEGSIDTCGIVWDRWARHRDDLQGKPLADAPRAPAQSQGISGACLLVSRAAYERVVTVTGEFFDRDFIAYREDAELCLRAGLIGVTSWTVPTAVGRHVRGLRGTERGKSAWIDYLGVRNRLLMRFKLGPNRPGDVVSRNLRDLVVVVGALTRERSSAPGLRDAWRLRRKMRAKRRLLADGRA